MQYVTCSELNESAYLISGLGKFYLHSLQYTENMNAFILTSIHITLQLKNNTRQTKLLFRDKNYSGSQSP